MCMSVMDYIMLYIWLELTLNFFAIHQTAKQSPHQTCPHCGEYIHSKYASLTNSDTSILIMYTVLGTRPLGVGVGKRQV